MDKENLSRPQEAPRVITEVRKFIGEFWLRFACGGGKTYTNYSNRDDEHVDFIARMAVGGGGKVRSQSTS